MLGITDKIVKEARERERSRKDESWNSLFLKLGKIYSPGRIILLSGTTGAGKTHIALGEAINSIMEGKKVLYVHSEMSDDQVISVFSPIWKEKYNNMLFLQSIDTFKEFIDIYNSTKEFEGFDLIILDYLDVNLVEIKNNTPPYQILNNIMRSFDKIRKHPTFRGCFLVLSQLNGRVNDKNTLNSLDLAGAKGIERSVDYHFSISPSTTYGALDISVRKDRYAVTEGREFPNMNFNYTLLDSCEFYSVDPTNKF